MEILLERDAMLIKVSPWIKEIEPLLVYEYASFQVGGLPNGDKKQEDRQKDVELRELFFLDENKESGYFPSGLLEEIISKLKGLGHSVVIKDYRDLKRLFPEPDWSAVDLKALRAGQKEVLEAITASDHGLIVCCTGFGKSFMIRTLCRMYPKSRFLIVAPGAADVRNQYYELIKEFPEETALFGVDGKGGDARISVSTTKSMLKAGIDTCDFFLYDEVHGCGDNQTTQNILANLGACRAFGFTATPAGRSDKSDRIMEAVFGNTIFKMDYQEGAEAGNVSDITVFIYDIGTPAVDGKAEMSFSPYDTYVRKKRKMYWRNEERNLSIAALAMALPEDEQTLIMVESIDHMIHLAQYLPDFALVVGSDEDVIMRAKKRKIKLTNSVAASSADRRRLEEDFKTKKVKKVISTFTWKQAVDFKELTVLIRGDGSPSKITSSQIPGRLSRIAKGKTRGILIDFRDFFSDVSLVNFYARVRNYRSNGWRIINRGSVLDETFRDCF